MSQQPTTLREIAREADVSVAAVSYVLNGKEGISEPRRRQIGALLKRAGLKPKHLRYPTFYICEHKSFTDLATYSPFFQKYEGLNSSFHKAGVGLRMEFLNRPDAQDLQSQLDELLSYKPGAVVLDSDLGRELPAVARFFEAQGVPAMQIGHTVRAPGVDAVVIDDFGGAYAATRHLADAGHTRIATIRWRAADDPASNKKYAAFQCALRDAGLDERPEYVVQSPHARVSGRLTGRLAVEQLLALPEPPTAVFVENSFVSASLLYPIDPSERELPEAIRQLDMVHFEAWHLDVIEQVMTGVFKYPARQTKLLRIDWAELGRVAARQVVERLKGAQATGQVIRLAPKLMAVEAMATEPVQELSRSDSAA